MGKFLKQFIFISLGLAILAAGGLAIYSATPSGKLKVNPILGHDLDLSALYYAQAADNTVHDITTEDISISAWVKVDSDQSGTSVILNKNTNNNGSYFFYVSNGIISFYVKDISGNAFFVYGTTNIKDNKWHYVTAIIDRDTQNNCKIYLDGIENSSTRSGTITSIGSLANTAIATLGAYSILSSILDGQIRDIKLYYAAGDHWTDAQVLYQAQHPFDYSANAGTLTDYWRLDEGTGTTLYGKPSTGYNLTLSNALAWTTQPKIKMVKQENATTTSNNPVGWWKFDETTAIHGSALADSSGNGNTGTLSTGDGATNKSVAGKLGRGVQFDGVDDYVDAGAGSSLNVGTGDLTVETWLKITIGGTNPYVFMSNRSGLWGDNSAGWEFRAVSTADRRYYFIVASSAHNVNSGAVSLDLNDGRWHHLVAVLDRDVNGYIYVDGVLGKTFSIASLVGESISSAYNLNIGRRVSTGYGTYEFSGLIDDVRIYNRALTAGEVAQMYNSTKDGYLGNVKVSTGLVGYWKLDDNNALTSVVDYSGKGNTGTAYSGTATSTSVLSTSTAMIGRAMAFDGVDDQITMPSAASIDFSASSAFTLSAWVKSSNLTGTFFAIGTNAVAFNYVVSIINGVLRVGNNSIEYTIGTATIPLDQWSYVGFVSNGTIVSGYINGVYIGQRTISNSGPTSEVARIGSKGSTNYFPGLIDEVKIWNYARSAEDIKNDYAKGLAGLQ